MQKEEYNNDYSDSDSEESLTPTAPPAPPVASAAPPLKKEKQSKLLEIQVEKKSYEDIEPITKRKYIRKNPIKVEDMNKKLEKARSARKPKIEKIVKDKKEKIVKDKEQVRALLHGQPEGSSLERTIINNYYYTKEDDKKEVVIKQPTASSLVGMQPIEKNNSKVIIKSKPLMTFV